MKPYRVVLFGHRDLREQRMVEERLFPLLGDLIRTKPFVEICVGRNGEFDVFAASVVKRAQKIFGEENSEMTLVLPYTQKDLLYYERYYDNVIVPDCARTRHPKGAITKRNQWMVETCDLLICYVERQRGGAWSAMKYAEKIGKRIINLSSDEFENKS